MADKGFAVALSPRKGEVIGKMQKLQMPFIKNEGQVDENIRFYSRTFSGTVSVTKDGEIVYSIPEAKGAAKKIVISEKISGGKVTELKGEGKAVTDVNYFKGKDRSKWKSNVPAFDSVDFGEVYNGIGLKLKAYGKNVEKLFFVKAGADYSNIRLVMEGSKGLTVNGSGELVVETELGPVKFTKPVAYQVSGVRDQVSGKDREYVEVEYVVATPHSPSPTPLLSYGFKVGAYDKTRELIIDPLLASTYLGGSLDDYANAIAVNQTTGDVYVTGYTSSADFPTVSGYCIIDSGTGVCAAKKDQTDVFVAKLDKDLTLSACTYLGGSGNDAAYNITLDGDGNSYITGETWSADFPKTDGTSRQGLKDAFIAKLSTNLNLLLAATYFGGSDMDTAHGIVYVSGEPSYVYVSGETTSSDLSSKLNGYTVTLPVTDPVTVTSDTFVAKLNTTDLDLISSVYIGGSKDDRAFEITTDGTNLYFAGDTKSDDLPGNTNAYTVNDPVTFDGFVAKLPLDLSSISTTYIGGAGNDGAKAIAVSGSDVYVAGDTGSNHLPLEVNSYSGAFQDVFVAKLNTSLVLGSTRYIGGDGTDTSRSLALKGDPVSIYVSGFSESTNLPVTDGAYDGNHNGSADVFIAKLDNALTISALTYLGGSASDDWGAMAIDQSGNVYVAGYTSSANFPVEGTPYQSSSAGGKDVFISKLESNLSAPFISTNPASPMDFGTLNVKDSTSQYLYIQTETGKPLHVDAISITGDPYFSLPAPEAGECGAAPLTLPFTLTAVDDDHVACPLNVKFDLTSNPSSTTAGQKTATIKITSNGSNGGLLEVTVQGTPVVNALTVNKSGNGTGTVTGTDSINCGSTCTDKFGNVAVSLAATADASSSNFTGWTGGTGSASLCSGTENCSFTITAQTAITAVFTLKTYTLTATRSGSGTVSANTGSLSLNGDAYTAQYNHGTSVTLTATAGTDYIFNSWSGSGCTGTGTCMVTVDAAKSVTATFVLNGACGQSNGQTLSSAPTANLCGTGTADTVSGTGPWIWNCAGANGGTTASCTAAKAAAINGACGSSDGQTFTAAPSATLCSIGTASTIGGSGPWTWSCVGTNGGTTASCTASKQAETVTPVNGACGPSNGQSLTTAPASDLCSAGTADTVSGSGPWTWNCAGTNGGTTASCSASKAESVTPVNGACGSSSGQTLTTAPGTDLCSSGVASSVSGSGPWTWNCTGTGGGTAADCSAISQSYDLTLITSGSGEGTVTSTPAGISCGTDCTETFNDGTEVTLTAVANSGSTFSGWSGGGCYGSDACVITVHQNEAVSATFTQDAPAGMFNLTVIMDGAGIGEIAVNKGELVCSDNVCTATYSENSKVTLTAQPGAESLFSAWDGCDSIKNKCTLSMDDNKVIMVTFIPFPKLVVTVVSSESEFGTGSGTVIAAGIKCGNSDDTGDTDCEQTYGKKMTVKLKAVAAKGSAFSEWQGCDSDGGSTCTVAVTIGDEDKEVIATFEATPRYSVAVVKDGNGSGKVTSSQKGIDNTGINCDAGETDCGSDYLKGTTITLIAQADKNGSKFKGWAGYAACEGKTTCKVRKIDTDVNLTATFIMPYNISGSVKDDAGKPVKSAVITLNGGDITGKKVRSNNKGVYTFKGIAPGSYTISASKRGYTFEDISVTVADANLTGQDLTGSK